MDGDTDGTIDLAYVFHRFWAHDIKNLNISIDVCKKRSVTSWRQRPCTKSAGTCALYKPTRTLNSCVVVREKKNVSSGRLPGRFWGLPGGFWRDSRGGLRPPRPPHMLVCTLETLFGISGSICSSFWDRLFFMLVKQWKMYNFVKPIEGRFETIWDHTPGSPPTQSQRASPPDAFTNLYVCTWKRFVRFSTLRI